MPRHKDFKRTVRARMQKTGESYTTARTRLLEKRLPRPAELARLAGISDDAVQTKTGKTWRQWVAALDAVGAIDMPHREIARHVGATYDLPSWWTQTVTVGYERIRGRREIGQRCDGGYEANKSKTFPVPLARLYRAFSVKRIRLEWLAGVEPTIRSSKVRRAMRMTWPDGTDVQIAFLDKGPRKSQVAIQHGGLAGRPDIAKRKQYWAERLAALATVLSD